MKSVCLLDGNVLVALADAAHVHHLAVVQWFTADDAAFATCPITQDILLRMLLRQGAVEDIDSAGQVLQGFTSHPRHRYWPAELAYTQVTWKGVLGYRQVTDAYLATLARANGGRLATLDPALAALHVDVAELIDVGRGWTRDDLYDRRYGG